MPARSNAMKIRSGREMSLKFITKSGPESSAGKKTVTRITTATITQNAIIRYLNFNSISCKRG